MSFTQLTQGSSKGRPTLYQGTGPGTRTAENSGGQRGSQSKSGGGFPFGSMNPSRVVNQSLGFQSNHTINYAYVCRRFKSGWDNALKQGQVVFIRKKSPPVGSGRLTSFVNLPIMNYWLANQPESKSASDLIDEWAPHGVILNEVGGNLKSQPQERLLNLTISGRVSCLNHWG